MKIPFTERQPYAGKNAKVLVTIPPRSIPCECSGNKKVEHQFNRESFNGYVFVCVKCGREKRVVE